MVKWGERYKTSLILLLFINEISKLLNTIKRQFTEWEKILPKLVSDNGLISKKKKKPQTVHAAQCKKKKKKILSNTNYKRSANQPSSHQKSFFCFPEDGAVTQGFVFS